VAAQSRLLGRLGEEIAEAIKGLVEKQQRQESADESRQSPEMQL
jgi:hypothetical protein